MRIVAEHPDLRRQYEQIVASKAHLGFFEQTWVQDALHPAWAYVLNAQNKVILRMPVAQKWGLRAYLQPLFLRSLSYVGDNEQEELPILLDFLSKKFLLHLNLTWPAELAQPLNNGIYQLLNTNKGIEDIRKKYSENVRRSLKKAKNLTLFNTSFTVFHSFFTEQKGENLGNLNAAAWLRLRTLFANAQDKEQAFCVGVLSGSELLAVGLFFKFNRQLYFMKGTLNAQGKEKGALVFLIDSVLEKHVDECASLDFIGSNQESIAAFYRKFGAEDHVYRIVKGRIPLF